jgi:hypothetical protein
MKMGRAIAQAVSRRLPTAAAWVRAQVVVDKVTNIGAGFLRVLRFLLSILIPLIASQSSSSHPGPNSGRSTKWTQSHPTP